MTDKVLIYRLGSLGDTVVALPALHLVARSFPGAERRVLTNFPANAKAPAMAAVLGESGLVNGYFRYPLGARSPLTLLKLRRDIAAWGPRICVYLAAPRGRRAVMRDKAFFRLCGIGQVIGAPDIQSLQDYASTGEAHWESETSRLSRCLAPFGETHDQSSKSWDLGFTDEERASAGALLAPWAGRHHFIAFSIGAKAEVKDWGDPNWRDVLSRVSARHPRLGLIILGAANEADRSAALAASWHGPALNLCGGASLRVGALALARASLFLGHDSGPMHLAAAVGTPCVAVFSARAKPGIWFPHGQNHRVHYNKTDCFDCGLETCPIRGKACIMAITPAAVAADVVAKLKTQDESLSAAVAS